MLKIVKNAISCCQSEIFGVYLQKKMTDKELNIGCLNRIFDDYDNKRITRDEAIVLIEILYS